MQETEMTIRIEHGTIVASGKEREQVLVDPDEENWHLFADPEGEPWSKPAPAWFKDGNWLLAGSILLGLALWTAAIVLAVRAIWG